MGAWTYGNIRAYIVNYLFSFYQFTHGYPYGYTNMGRNILKSYFENLNSDDAENHSKI